jgi:hypothetical protein
MKHLHEAGFFWGAVAQLVKKLNASWNQRAHYRVHKRLPVDLMLGQLNPIHNLTPSACVSKIHFHPKIMTLFRFQGLSKEFNQIQSPL